MALLNDQAAMWPTPSVADTAGGRKTRSGDRSGELLNNSLAPLVADLAFAPSSPRPAPATSTPGAPSPNALLSCYRRYRATTDSDLRSERRALLLMAIRRRDPAPKRKPARHGGAQVRVLRVGWTREQASPWTRPVFRRQLNPRFVEWLMGWPPGSTNFACSATAWRTHAERWRSEISQLSFPPAPPAQLALFA